MASQGNDEEVRWYVMRDLKRTNAKQPAYKLLKEKKMEVFVPMRWHLSIRKGVRVREEVPFIQDMLFVHETQKNLDSVVEKTPTLQYRWLRKTWREPMTVADADMERFIHAVSVSESPKYYLPEEITPAMYGRKIRIVGGPLNGYEGGLITVRGSKVKRLLVELKGFLAVGVEVNPEYIQLI
jgi:hypothetical protein